jgi:peptidoglycan/xylan/chitin deacetylase (PgdA/CDA1 family)
LVICNGEALKGMRKFYIKRRDCLVSLARMVLVVAFGLFLLSSCRGVYKENPALADNSKPLFTFVFDDGNATDYLAANDIFKTRGEVACSAVVTDWINTKNYLTASQLLELQNDGWEILSHTKSHPNLRELSGDRIENEMSQSKATLENLGIKVKNLVYPFNMNNDLVRNIARKYYRSARGGRSMPNPYVIDRYELKSYSVKHNVDKMKGYIDKAYSERKWLIFYHHGIEGKIKIANKKGAFVPGEILNMTPSGAKGGYIEDSGSTMLFVPLSGTPQANDTIVGRSSGAACDLTKALYNERENIIDIIEYIRNKYPDMHIVTIDEGLNRTNLF